MNNVFIILVKPQLGKNIGSVARVMKNLNFKNLRIVNPRDGWPNQDVISTAAGADDVLTNTKVFDNVFEACNARRATMKKFGRFSLSASVFWVLITLAGIPS